MADLTKSDIASLRHMQIVNDLDDVGLFWSSVGRHGRVKELDHLVESGACELRHKRPGIRGIYDRRAGYWITPAGRKALAEAGERNG